MDKTCTTCGETKLLEQFLFRKERGKHSTQCRNCTNARQMRNLRKSGKGKQYFESWKANNPDAYRQRYERANKKVYSTPEGKFRCLLSNALYRALKGIRKHRREFEKLGYTLEELKQHLERQFQPGMTWENYGEWHVDHVVPVTKCQKIVSLDDPAVKEVWGLPNLQPLWAEQNSVKSNRMPISYDYLKRTYS